MENTTRKYLKHHQTFTDYSERHFLPGFISRTAAKLLIVLTAQLTHQSSFGKSQKLGRTRSRNRISPSPLLTTLLSQFQTRNNHIWSKTKTSNWAFFLFVRGPLSVVAAAVAMATNFHWSERWPFSGRWWCVQVSSEETTVHLQRFIFNFIYLWEDSAL